MLAGSLDRRLAWQLPYKSIDGYGNDVVAWRTAFETWCGEVRTAGAYLVQAQEDTKEKTVTLQIRHRANLETTHRFVYEGRKYRIVAIDNIGREGLFVVGKTRTDAEGADDELPDNVASASGSSTASALSS